MLCWRRADQSCRISSILTVVLYTTTYIQTVGNRYIAQPHVVGIREFEPKRVESSNSRSAKRQSRIILTLVAEL